MRRAVSGVLLILGSLGLGQVGTHDQPVPEVRVTYGTGPRPAIPCPECY